MARRKRKSKVGRPRLRIKPRVYRPVLTLHPGADDDLIVLLDTSPVSLSQTVKDAMRRGSVDAPADGETGPSVFDNSWSLE